MRGGARPGAGRKSNAEIFNMRHLLDQALAEDEWIEIFQSLSQSARQGNLQAAKLLFQYRFGQPSVVADEEEDLPQIQMVEVVKEVACPDCKLRKS